MKFYQTPPEEEVSAVKPTRPHDHPARVGGTAAIISHPTSVTVGPFSTPVKINAIDESNKIAPNCCAGVKIYKFEYGMFYKLPKNSKLKYRKDGDIDYDPTSRSPSHCDYNAAREVIRQAKVRGQNHIHWRTSTAIDRELIKDGYHISNDMFDTIYWGNFDRKHLVYRDEKHRQMGNREDWDNYVLNGPSSSRQVGTSGTAGTSGSSGSSGRGGRSMPRKAPM